MPTAPPGPPLECDLVMKGGITSGVVYPLAVTELSRVYRLRSVGGASAGAIAAAAAACAELGRTSGGFEKLTELPRRLTEQVEGGRSRLFTLFAPHPRMRRLFALVTAGLGTTGRGRATAMAGAALRAWLPYAAAGAAPGLLLVVLGFALGGPAAWACLVAGLLLAVVGLVAGTAYGALRDVADLPEVGFGLATGATPPGASTPALTPWLHETFQHLAGRTVDDPPVTFGDLGTVGVTLQLMTTNLSRRQPLTMPLVDDEYWWEPAHFRTLFPAAVVDRMEHADPTPQTPLDRDDWVRAVHRLHAEGREPRLLPFPAAADLPVVVAVRMSLSFPGLIAAVPLHAYDDRRAVNRSCREQALARFDADPACSPEDAAAALDPREAQVNWFSDGGICANLPLHFFDSALPRRPTFAINLAEFPPDRPKSTDERENSDLPEDDEQVARRQTVWEGSGPGLLLAFFASIVETARTWVDEAQLAMPGYRDRIVTVLHDGTEGGLNLDMPQPVVMALSERGAGAAERLVRRYAGDEPGVVPAPGWDRHRWLRFRTAGAAFSDVLGSFRAGYETVLPGTTPYDRWVGVDADGTGADAPLPSYELDAERRDAVNRRTEGLLETAEDWARDPADAFTRGAPEPRPSMKLVPSDRAGRAPGPR
ncbi:hypothetical protein [Nocardioides aurantiacus]|uniref:hypothetical protein n=1 Tax=Nocardioides aurantiacus TaxID=86796 RepID=UPI00403F1255